MRSIFPAIFSTGAGSPVPELDPSFSPWSWDDFTPIPTLPKPGLGEPARVQEEDPNEPVSIMEERKRKRQLSNRDSARRSRMRRLNHVEGLVRHVTQLKAENRELSNRFGIVNHRLLLTRMENQRLLDECVVLRRRLAHNNQSLHLMQLQTYPIQYY